MNDFKEKVHLCWTCGNVCTDLCPKWKNKKPKGHLAFKHKFDIPKKGEIDDLISYTVIKCPMYEYDGECVRCMFNKNKEQKCLYDTCPHHIKNAKGYCAQENWKRKFKTEIERDEAKYGQLFDYTL